MNDGVTSWFVHKRRNDVSGRTRNPEIQRVTREQEGVSFNMVGVPSATQKFRVIITLLPVRTLSSLCVSLFVKDIDPVGSTTTESLFGPFGVCTLGHKTWVK